MVTKRKVKKEPAVVEAVRVGKDEMNLTEFPLNFMTNRSSDEVKTLVFNDSHGKLIVTGSDLLGLPTPIDADVLIALMELTKKRNDFKDQTVNFTRYELIQLIGWANVGSSYDRIEQSLNRWAGVLLIYDGNFWDNRTKSYRSETMHIIESVSIAEGRAKTMQNGKQESFPLSSFTWSKQFIRSCQNNNIKDLNTLYYFSLRYPSSKQLFRFLDKRFYRRSDLTFDLEEIGFERVGLSRNYNASKIKEKLADAIGELESTGFLKPLSREERFFKTAKGWQIRFVAGNFGQPVVPGDESAPVTQAKDRAPAPSRLAVELSNRGVTEATAVELVQHHQAELIEAKLEEFDWLVEKKDKKVAKSPAGFLVKSITTGESGYKTPPGFTSRAKREQAEAQKQAKACAEDKARRRQREIDAAEMAERMAITRYWESLTPEEQVELDTLSIAQADPETLAMENGPMKSFGQTLRRHGFIRHLLATRQVVTSEE